MMWAHELLMSLFWALGVKAGVLVLLAVAAIRLLRLRQLGLELAVWRAVLLSVAILVPLQLLLPEWQPDLFASVPAVTTPAPEPTLVSGTETRFVEFSWVPILKFGSILFVFGALYGLSDLLLGLLRLWRWSAQATPIREQGARQLLNRLARQMQVKGQVRALWSKRINGPLSWGRRPPTILLPQQWTRATDTRLKHAIAHELAHVSRGDWTWHLLARTLGAVCWWNPLVRLAVRRHGEQVEQACDHLAVVHCGSPRDYARSLLAAAGCKQGLAAMTMAAGTGLRERIVSLINLNPRRLDMKPSHKLISDLAIAMIVLPLAACTLTQAAESAPPVVTADAPVLAVTGPATGLASAPMVSPTPDVTDSIVVPDGKSAIDVGAAPFAPSPPDVASPPDPIRIEPLAPVAISGVSAGHPRRPPRAEPTLAPQVLTERAHAVRAARAEAVLAGGEAVQAERQARVSAQLARERGQIAEKQAQVAADKAQQAQRRAEDVAALRAEQAQVEQARVQEQSQVAAELKQELSQTRQELETTRQELQLMQERLLELEAERNQNEN